MSNSQTTAGAKPLTVARIEAMTTAELQAFLDSHDKLVAALADLHEKAKRVVGLIDSGYLRAISDGGRVAHAVGQLEIALASAASNGGTNK